MNVIKSVFRGEDREGDFGWMIRQPQHDRTLFIFNDNEEEFYAHFRGTPHTCSAGGGNAVIRPYQCDPHRRAAGMPTGTYKAGPHHMGYTSLDDQVRRAIADSITQIESLLATDRFDSLAFSWSDDTKLGGKIFATAQVVRDHIVDEILRIAATL